MPPECPKCHYRHLAQAGCRKPRRRVRRDYVCRECEHTIESTERLDGERCFFAQDGCEGGYRRVWTAPAVKFHGPGFHTNDYAGA